MRTQPDAVRVDSRLHPIDISFDALVVDESDPAGPLAVRRIVTQTLMTDLDASRRLAETVLEAAA